MSHRRVMRVYPYHIALYQHKRLAHIAFATGPATLWEDLLLRVSSRRPPPAHTANRLLVAREGIHLHSLTKRLAFNSVFVARFFLHPHPPGVSATSACGGAITGALRCGAANEEDFEGRKTSDDNGCKGGRISG